MLSSGGTSQKVQHSCIACYDKMCSFMNKHGLVSLQGVDGIMGGSEGVRISGWPTALGGGTRSPSPFACPPLSKINKNILFIFKKENKRLNTEE